MKTDFIAAAGKICEQDVLVATRGYNFQRSLRKWFYMLGDALISLFLKAWVYLERCRRCEGGCYEVSLWYFLAMHLPLLC